MRPAALDLRPAALDLRAAALHVRAAALHARSVPVTRAFGAGTRPRGFTPVYVNYRKGLQQVVEQWAA